MAESVIAITEGSGKNDHTWSRTVNSITVEDRFRLLAEPVNDTFTALASSIVTTTGASHLIFIQADGTNYTRIKRIFVEQVVGATTQTLAQLQVFRTSTAGSGGSAITARGYDSADSYTGTIQTLPSSKGTEGNQLLQKRLQLQTTAQVAATTVNPNSWEWLAREDQAEKPIIIGPTSTDGICLKLVTGIATSTVDITVEFTVDTSL